MALLTSTTDDDTIKKVVKELKQCNIRWEDQVTADMPVARVSFIKKGDKYEATINVKSASGKAVVINERVIFKDYEGVGKEIALRLFGKSGALVYEKPV